MIIKQSSTNPLIWNCIPTALPEIFECLVKYVAEQGGKFIYIKDEYIKVDDAMKFNRLVDRYVIEAKKLLALYEASHNTGDRLVYKCRMEQAAALAGANYCLYASVLGRYAIPNVTSHLSDHHVLKNMWDVGYANQEVQLSRTSDD